MEFEELTEQIIGCAFKVYNSMGFGFLAPVFFVFYPVDPAYGPGQCFYCIGVILSNIFSFFYPV